MKAICMFEALADLLNQQNDILLPFSVEPVPESDEDNYIDNSAMGIPDQYRRANILPCFHASLFMVIGGGEAQLGLIYHVCDEHGNNVATYWG